MSVWVVVVKECRVPKDSKERLSEGSKNNVSELGLKTDANSQELECGKNNV
jgi:hypothetical protein